MTRALNWSLVNRNCFTTTPEALVPILWLETSANPVRYRFISVRLTDMSSPPKIQMIS